MIISYRIIVVKTIKLTYERTEVTCKFWIKLQRTKLKLSQYDIVNKTGFSKSYVSKIGQNITFL